MSEHASPTVTAGKPVTLQNGLEAFQSSTEFKGPVEALDDHRCNDHFAQIYESDAERFAAAVPFVRHGIERDEHVMYVIDESSDAEVRAALRDGGIDVDAALDSGALSFHTVQETYLRNGSFDPDEMIDFYGDTVAEATEDYEALRIVAETTWLQDDATTVEQFMEYESKVNHLFASEDCLALCQYDRDGFSPEVVRNIVQTHPHLIYDGTACHNFYYTPPAEFFGPDRPKDEVDRMLGTLRDRTEAKAELQRHDRFLQELYRITADQRRSFEEKIHALLDLGCEQFGLDVGGLNRVDPDADHFEVEYLNGEHELFEPGAEFPLSETYCQAAADIEAAATVVAPTTEGFDDVPVFEEFGIKGYIGTYIPVDGGMDRTLGFLPGESDTVSFSEEDRTFLELMGQWIGYELNCRQRERFLRECYELTSDPSKSYEEKLHGLFDLGCEQFGFEVGGLSKVDPDTDLFEVEAVNGDHDHFEPGARADLSETYCRLVTEDGETSAVTDPVDAGFEGNLSYERFGVQAYLGTHLEVDGDANRTFWFASTEPRDAPITDEERTFVHLMGQWVKYELEHQQRERELRERTEYLNALVETAPECIKTVAADGTLLQMNSAGLDMVEADRASAVTGECVYDLIAPEDRERFREFNERICRGERGTLEFDIVGLEGTRRHMETHAAPLERPDEATAQVALTRDITEQVEREQQLEKTVEELEASNERLESFASMLAHELRNPTMIGQIYSQQLPDDAEAEAVEYVTEAFDRIEDMIDVMLVLTRGGEAVGEQSPVELPTVAREAWTNVDAPDADLDVEIDDIIEADETYINHLFRNLFENAVEHGGTDVTVTVGDLDDVSSSGGSEDERSESSGGFYVADDGPGIPAGDRDAVFEPGYTTAADSGGSGLGLAFVQKLAEVYEWNCAVTESAAGGARFEFRVA